MAITLFKWLYILLFHAVHPIYISVTEINHNPNDKTLEISCKLFADDFEKVLTKKTGTAVHILKPKDKASLDKMFAQYLGENFSVKADGKTASLFYLGFEVEEDAVYCYMQANDIASLKKIELFNTLLYDLNDKQAGIMHVTVNGNRKSTKLDYPASQVTIQF